MKNLGKGQREKESKGINVNAARVPGERRAA